MDKSISVSSKIRLMRSLVPLGLREGLGLVKLPAVDRSLAGVFALGLQIAVELRLCPCSLAADSLSDCCG